MQVDSELELKAINALQYDLIRPNPKLKNLNIAQKHQLLLNKHKWSAITHWVAFIRYSWLINIDKPPEDELHSDQEQFSRMLISALDVCGHLYAEFYWNKENPPYKSYAHWWLGYVWEIKRAEARAALYSNKKSLKRKGKIEPMRKEVIGVLRNRKIPEGYKDNPNLKHHFDLYQKAIEILNRNNESSGGLRRLGWDHYLSSYTAHIQYLHNNPELKSVFKINDRLFYSDVSKKVEPLTRDLTGIEKTFYDHFIAPDAPKCRLDETFLVLGTQLQIPID
ncbi:hypothetical protein Pse7367_0868 [Thalassoporum mexicanum PCC 7367]|uniref:hypothetical protein n=1 Tax=Thalassoporum mexicanum TaxID=3457544 RepID=UPI00029FC784|nr:hypothetical protein [Pseudanabaena sp. PCC 7367]AFY69168.1 hypothetical protein Pse7367_0868 [Pseudanabaena sp. PCC 7367]